MGQEQLIITAVGPDRPGIVDSLTGVLSETGATIADSRMINLQGQFAMIVLASAAAERIEELRARLNEFGKRHGMAVSAGAHAGASQPVSGLPFRLSAYAMDQPGIVHRITNVLHRHGINIEELQTSLESGSYSGTPLFTLELHMTVPAAVRVKQLRAELETLCDALNCDVKLEPA